MFKVRKGYLKDRQEESHRVLKKYPDRVPVVCERYTHSAHNIPHLSKTKYLIPNTITMGQFLYVIRSRLQLPPTVGLFIYTDNRQLPGSIEVVRDVYDRCRDTDGFLYLYYTGENVYGGDYHGAKR